MTFREIYYKKNKYHNLQPFGNFWYTKKGDIKMTKSKKLKLIFDMAADGSEKSEIYEKIS